MHFIDQSKALFIIGLNPKLKLRMESKIIVDLT
jgi:hypothetical protein